MFLGFCIITSNQLILSMDERERVYKKGRKSTLMSINLKGGMGKTFSSHT